MHAFWIEVVNGVSNFLCPCKVVYRKDNFEYKLSMVKTTFYKVVNDENNFFIMKLKKKKWNKI